MVRAGREGTFCRDPRLAASGSRVARGGVCNFPVAKGKALSSAVRSSWALSRSAPDLVPLAALPWSYGWLPIRDAAAAECCARPSPAVSTPADITQQSTLDYLHLAR